MRQASIIILSFFTLAALVATAFLWQLQTADDPLESARVELQKIRIMQNIERLKVKQEVESRETAIVKAELARQERIESNQGVNVASVALAMFWRLSLPLSFITAIAGAGVYAFARRVPVKTPFIETMLPVRRAAALAEKSLQVSNAAEMGKALAFQHDISQQQIHSAVEIFRSLKPGRENITVNQSALPAAAEQPQAGHMPTFAELFRAGKFEPGKPLVFGFDNTGAAKTGTWSHAYSLGIAGMSGSGKSSTIRLIMSESLLTGAVGAFYVIDPHYPHLESLLASLGELKDAPQVRYCENPIDTAAMIAEIHAAIDRRLAGNEASTPLLVVVVDELPVVVKKFPKIADLIERVGMESRKAGVYGMFSAQSWNGDKTGGTTARDNLTALMVHRMKRKQAQTLLQDADLTRQVLRLQPGQVLFSPTKGDPDLLTVPYCTLADMSSVVSVLKSATICADVDRSDGERENVLDDSGAAENVSQGKIGSDIELISAIRQKNIGVNELARQLGRDRSQISKALNYGIMTPSLRQALYKFIMYP